MPSRVTEQQGLEEGWYKPNANNGKCHCGCGMDAPIARDTQRKHGVIGGKPQRYLRGHQRTGKGRTAKGVAHHNWKGGRSLTSKGYVRVYAPDHPSARKKYVLEHRLVMEGVVGRYLEPQEVVHHINGVRDDNRPENLKLFANQIAHVEYERSILRDVIRELVEATSLDDPVFERARGLVEAKQVRPDLSVVSSTWMTTNSAH